MFNLGNDRNLVISSLVGLALLMNVSALAAINADREQVFSDNDVLRSSFAIELEERLAKVEAPSRNDILINRPCGPGSTKETCPLSDEERAVAVVHSIAPDLVDMECMGAEDEFECENDLGRKIITISLGGFENCSIVVSETCLWWRLLASQAN